MPSKWEAGGKVTDVVRVTTYGTDINNLEGTHKVRKGFIPDGKHPTATHCQVVKLEVHGLLLGTEAFAVIGSS